MTVTSDQLLVARVKSGDQQAAEELYQRYAARVFGLVRSQMAGRLKSQVEPEDIVQSIFKSVFRGVSRSGYDAPPGGTLWQLIAVIAVNKVRRKASRQATLSRDVSRTQSLESAEQDLPLRGCSETEMAAAIEEAVSALKPVQHEVVLLRIQGFTVEEIATHTSKSRRTIERLLQNARETLTKSLELEE